MGRVNCFPREISLAVNPDRAVVLPAPFPVITLVLAFAACILYLFPGLAAALQYDRSARLISQLPRYLTCHWSHWSPDHLGWSVLAFVVLGVAVERRGRGRFVACVIGAIVIPLALRLLQPGIRTYRGLSGIDSALFVLLAVTLLRERLTQREDGWRIWSGAIVLALIAFVGKIVLELSTGTSVFANAASGGFVPVPLAHLAGGTAGMVAALPILCRGTACRVRTPAGKDRAGQAPTLQGNPDQQIPSVRGSRTTSISL